MPEIEKIALFDFDGVLADYDFAMIRDYDRIKSPEDAPYLSFKKDQEPAYIKERIRLIRNKSGWWQNLPEFERGFDILRIAIEQGFEINVATKAPLSAKNSWTEKAIWFEEHIKPLAPKAKLTITEDKGLLYGTVFVEDYPENIERWLTWRKRGVVIMPAHSWNQNYLHPNVTRYDGTNLCEVLEKMTWAKNR